MTDFTTGIVTGDEADRLNEMSDILDRLANISGAPPIDVNNNGGGITISYNGNDSFPALIISGDNPYSWAEQEPQADGSFEDKEGGRFGNSSLQPAYELNGNTKAASQVVFIYPWYFDATLGQTFAFSTCCDGTGSSGSGEGSSSSSSIISVEIAVPPFTCGSGSETGEIQATTAYLNYENGLFLSITFEPLGTVQAPS